MHRFGKGFAVFVLLLTAVAGAWASAFRAAGPTVYVNEVPVLAFRTASGSLDPAMRAAIVVASFEALQKSGDVTVAKSGPDAVIAVAGTACVTVTGTDADKAKMSPMGLANVWARRIKEAMQLPPLKLSADSVEMPLGAVRKVQIVGSKALDAEVTSGSKSIVSVKRDGNTLELRAVGPGAGSVTVAASGVQVPLNVTVRPFAADFPQSLSTEVTGVPAYGSAVTGAISTTMRTLLKGQPGAKFSYKLPEGAPTNPGAERTYKISVRAEAPDCYPNYGTVTLTVKNAPLPRRQDAELWYSNNPEILRGAEPLFSATLKQDAPARLLYHHVNGSSQAMYLRVQAVNDSDQSAKVVVIPGDSPPDPNPVRAGLVAANQYFRAWAVGSGEVVTIPPHSTLPISLRRLSPGDTGSGLCGLRLVSGPKELLVRTDSWPPFPLEASWRAAIESSTPWREVGCPPINDFDRAPFTQSEHIYPNPQKAEQMSYEVGGRYGFFRIGQRAIQRYDQGSQLDGNFGVIYNIKAAVQNPTTEATDVEVVFEASAGYSGGLFLVNGNLVQTPLLQPKEEISLTRFRMTPGASRYLDITTIPLSGSSYPATITIRPVLSTSAGRPLQTVKK